ncbi:MAG: acyl-CoA dehydrogenase family protein [Thermodesulfobacteriota bacterium]
MNFALTQRQQELREMLRDFVEKEVRPGARGRDASEEFPRALILRLGELGVLGAMVPAAYGGAGMDMVSYAIAVEEIAKGDGSLGLTFASHHSLSTAYIQAFGPEPLRRKYLPELASGRMLGAFALTEPGSGSDALSMRAHAERKGDRWLLNGSKMFVTQGSVAGVYVVLALTDKARPKDGVTAFAVPAGTPGLSVGKKLDKLGMRSSDTAELFLDDVEVGDDAILGRVNSAFRDTLTILDAGRISIAALATGIGMGALEEAVGYMKERGRSARPSEGLQGSEWMLADMGTELEAAELLTLRAAFLKDRGRPYGMEASIAKLFASEAAMRCAEKAIRLLGMEGCTEERPVERFLRDAKLCEIGEGTSEVQRMIIARNLIRGR